MLHSMQHIMAWPGAIFAQGASLSATPAARRLGRSLLLAGGALGLLRLAGLG